MSKLTESSKNDILLGFFAGVFVAFVFLIFILRVLSL